MTASTTLWLGTLKVQQTRQPWLRSNCRRAASPSTTHFGGVCRRHALFAAGGSDAMTRAAAAIGQAVTNGPRTAWLVRLDRTLNDLQGRTTARAGHEDLFLGWDTWLRESGATAQRDLTRARAMLDGTHDQRADGLITLARLSGAGASDRPDRARRMFDGRGSRGEPLSGVSGRSRRAERASEYRGTTSTSCWASSRSF